MIEPTEVTETTEVDLKNLREVRLNADLAQFTPTELAIAGLRAKYTGLKIAGPDDQEGFEVVKRARLDVRKFRTRVEEIRKDLKEESLEKGRRIDAEAKRITALILEIETPLADQEQRVIAERERIAAEAAAARAAMLAKRVADAKAVGLVFDGVSFSSQHPGTPTLTKAEFDALADFEFEVVIGTCAKAKAEAERIAAEAKAAAEAAEAQRVAEAKAAAEKLEAERRELEAQRAADAKAKAEADAKAAAEAAKLEEERAAFQREREAFQREKAEAEAAKAAAAAQEARKAQEAIDAQAAAERAAIEAATPKATPEPAPAPLPVFELAPEVESTVEIAVPADDAGEPVVSAWLECYADCPHCGETVQVTEWHRGAVVVKTKCLECEKDFTVNTELPLGV